MNEAYTIVCPVVGFPLPKTQWLFNNMTLKNQYNAITFHNNSVFPNVTIKKMSSQMSGIYTLVAKKKFGKKRKDIKVNMKNVKQGNIKMI